MGNIKKCIFVKVKQTTMDNLTFTPGQSVTHKKFGVGTVTSFDGKKVTVDFGGSQKTLIAKFCGLKAGTSVVTHADKYKARKAKEARKAEEAKPKTANDFIQDNKTCLLMVNRKDSASQSVFEADANRIGTLAVEQNNTFIQSIIDNALKYRSMSEKQAYCVAKYAFQNNITL